MNTTAQIFSPVQSDILAVEELMLNQTEDQHPDLKAALDLIIKAGGKRIRPTITLLIGHMLGVPRNRLITLSAAIEMLHTATLVHDDLIDGSLLRRGMPTLNSQWSPGATVLTGDFLFARAAKLAADTDSIPVMKIFANTLSTIVNGEITQQFSGKCQVDRQNYFIRIYAKTASLFETSAWTSALLSAHEAYVDEMRAYGYNIGMAFQIIDDILDFTGQQSTIGKPVGSDLKQGLITLPVLEFYNLNPKHSFFDLLKAGECLDLTMIENLIADLKNSTAIESSHSIACEYINNAISQLNVLPESQERQALHALANFIIDRDL